MDFRPFNQSPPALGNQYDDDRPLRSLLARHLPADVNAAIAPSLREMGELAGGELLRMQAEDRLNEPELVQWSPWGERIDRIEITPLWKRCEVIVPEHGVVAAAYEPTHGPYARLHQFALAYLFGPSSDVYTCPLAMTDGAARTLLAAGNQALIDRAVPRLTTRDPKTFWTSGQWMTESTGGSDVGKSETVAVAGASASEYTLWGRKWFTSATTSQMALTLGRPEGNGPGGKGLALFYVETRDADGRLHNIEVNRLKDKLGTRKVPTAELMLRGTPAIAVAGTSNGIRNITPMLSVTRTWNAVMSVAFMRRAVALARDYAKKRDAFGSKLSDKPLHLDTLGAIAAEGEAMLHLAFETVAILGRLERGGGRPHDETMLRLLTPIVKLTTGKSSVAIASETLECFGGAGYVEDTGLPTLLRDAQVLPIWEGTTNVLSLDTLRAMGHSADVFEAIEAESKRLTGEITDGELAGIAKSAVDAIRRALGWLAETAGTAPLDTEASARRFALTLGRSYALLLLASHADWSLKNERDRRSKAAAQLFAEQPFDLLRVVPRDRARSVALDEA
ncbi:MAG: acyl-CoA dehydrogenase family protein [Deltaproteobacteria bacterium]|nr:acyl-CoA dehydrogenase family protein [Deltaproteobacteria bacterium]